MRINARIFRWLGYALLAPCALAAVLLLGFRLVAFGRETQERTELAPKAGRFFRAADVDLYVQEWGPKNGPAVLLLHAAGGWSGVWQRTGEVLAREGFRAIAFDLPPLGFSQRPARPSYTREAQARRVIGLLDALGLNQAVIVGHSFGGRAAAQAALARPERVAKLVLVDAALTFPQAGESPPLLVSAAMAIGPVRRAFAAVTCTNPLFTRTLLKSFVANPASATDHWVGVYQAAMRVRGTTDAIGDWLPQLVDERDTSLSSERAAYGKLRMPVAVIWGERDTTTPLVLGREIAGLVPNSTLIVLAGTGHLPPVEDAAAFERALLRVLKD